VFHEAWEWVGTGDPGLSAWDAHEAGYDYLSYAYGGQFTGGAPDLVMMVFEINNIELDTFVSVPEWRTGTWPVIEGGGAYAWSSAPYGELEWSDEYELTVNVYWYDGSDWVHLEEVTNTDSCGDPDDH
jgi:hypothetical protein